MNTKDLRILIAAQFVGMALHPHYRDRLLERPSKTIQEALWLADLLLEHAKQKEEDICL